MFVNLRVDLLTRTSVYSNYYSVYLFQWEETIKVFYKLQITLLLSLLYDSIYKPIVKEGSQQHFFRTHINKRLISHRCPIFPNTDMQLFTALGKSLHLLELWYPGNFSQLLNFCLPDFSEVWSKLVTLNISLLKLQTPSDPQWWGRWGFHILNL